VRRLKKGKGWLHNKFYESGCKMTASREIIINVLSRQSEHPSAEEIYIKVHKLNPSVGLTTIYRTLELLVQKGLIYKFDFGDGRSRYELVENSDASEHHHHLICTNCNMVINYTDFIDKEVELLNTTETQLEKKYNFKITNHLIQFYGLCNTCSKKGDLL